MAAMLQTKRHNDTMPYLKAAGIGMTDRKEHESAALALQPPPDNRPATPEHMRRYRKSYQNTPGLRFYHAGLVGQTLPPSHVPYGIKTKSSGGESVGDSFQQVAPTELMEYYNTLNEAIYDSNIREPLGTSYTRGHALPVVTHEPIFRFGKASTRSEGAGGLIYSTEAPPDKQVRAPNPQWNPLYHRERDLTKQIDRKYDWESTGVNPIYHRFGKVGEVEKDGVKAAMQGDMDATKIGSKRVKEFKAYSQDGLGTQRPPRGTLRDLGTEFVYGRFNTPDEWGGKKCIAGEYSQSDMLPDKDLGISVRKLNPLEAPPFDADHVYGVPSIRGDIAKPKLRSVADPQNYGDEHSAKGLLYPSKYAYDGVSEDQFTAKRGPEEIREIFKKMGHNFIDAEFDRICELANRDFGVLSADSFRHAWNKDLLDTLTR